MEPLIAFSGKMSCGKTTISSHLSNTYGYNVLSIASAIKTATNLLIEDKKGFLDFLHELIQDSKKVARIFRKLTLLYYYRFNLVVRGGRWQKDTNGNYLKNKPYRKLLQAVATHIRKELGETIWVELFAKQAVTLSEQGQKVICDDLRLPREKEILEKAGFLILRIEVDENERLERVKKLYGEIDEKALNHPTETSLDEANFDYILNTSSASVEENLHNVTNYLKGEK